MDSMDTLLLEQEAAFTRWSSGAQPAIFARAPGRVNLIGEHTDYNQGLVLPVAIDREVVVLGRTVPGRTLRVFSHSVDEEAIVSLDEPIPDPDRTWINVVAGMAAGLQTKGLVLPGMELMLWSTVPLGAGLSSSAAYEMAVLRAFELLGAFTLTPNDAVDLAQTAEWQYAGTRSGIMDQTISRLGEAGHALLLDCRSRDWEQVPMAIDAELVVCHSGVGRSLSRSAYNERREQCEKAVEILRASLPGITSLRDVSPEEWERLEDTVPEPYRRRARHVITEDARVPEAAAALQAGDLPRLAELFAASQQSLRDDYQVSSVELDTLVAIANEVDPGIPSRLTGAGFGGCTINLVPPDLIEPFERRILEEYPARTGRKPAIYRCVSADGASGTWLRGDIVDRS